MADVKILEINGTEFNIKDEKARRDIEKVNTQLSTIEYDEDKTLDLLLEYGLVTDALMLNNGTYLVDENGKLFQI